MYNSYRGIYQLIPGPVKEKDRVCAHDVIKTKDPTKGFILIRHKNTKFISV